MRNIRLPLTSLAVIFVSCASSLAAVSPHGSVGYWSLDQKHIDGAKIIDSSGGDHDGTILGATLVAGRQGAGLKLDGKDSGLTIENLGIKTPQATVSIWINPAQHGVRRLIHFNGLWQVGFAEKVLFVHTGRIGRADTNLPYAEVDVPLNKWTHLAVTWDTAAKANNVKVYLNGFLAAQATLDACKGKQLTMDTLRIGCIEVAGSQGQAFAGIVDEIAIYDRALKAGQIRSYCARVLSAAGAGAPQPVRERVITQGSVEPPKPYYPKQPYKGRQKLLRVGSELISRMLDSKSIAEADLPTRVKQWQQTGLDGLVFTITSTDRDNLGRYWNMCGQWWALVPRTYEELEPDIKAFQSVKDWGRLTDNFLWSSYAVWKDGGAIKVQNWFNDDHWKIILANVKLQARVARECGFKGVLFDTEQYEGHSARGAWHIPFSYPNYSEDGYKKAGESAPRPFDEVAAKIRQRGEQYARALCSEFPGLKLMIIAGLYEFTARLGDGPLPENHNGLYPSFLDGVLAGLDDQATLIGGNELTYDHTRYVDIGKALKAYDDSIDKLCKAPEHLKKKMSFAAGIWADAGRTWSDTDVSKNVRSPADHETALRNAFRASGEYAWLYGEQSRFLTMKPTPLLREYFKANEQAHRKK